MLWQTRISRHTPDVIMNALDDDKLAQLVVSKLFTGVLGVDDTSHRAAYAVEQSDACLLSPDEGEGPYVPFAILILISGLWVTEDRETKVFHDLLKAAPELVKDLIQPLMDAHDEAHVFCQLVLDKEIDSSPKSGYKTSLPESEKLIFKAFSTKDSTEADEDEIIDAEVAEAEQADEEEGFDAEEAEEEAISEKAVASSTEAADQGESPKDESSTPDVESNEE